MKSPDADSGDQAVGDRQNKHIAEVEGEADYEGGRRDHREGVRRPYLASFSRDRTPELAMHWAVPCIGNLAKMRVEAAPSQGASR